MKNNDNHKATNRHVFLLCSCIRSICHDRDNKYYSFAYRNFSKMELLKMNKEALGSEESKHDNYFTMSNLSAKLNEVHSRIIHTEKMNHKRQSGINLLTKITKK